MSKVSFPLIVNQVTCHFRQWEVLIEKGQEENLADDKTTLYLDCIGEIDASICTCVKNHPSRHIKEIHFIEGTSKIGDKETELGKCLSEYYIP